MQGPRRDDNRDSCMTSLDCGSPSSSIGSVETQDSPRLLTRSKKIQKQNSDSQKASTKRVFWTLEEDTKILVLIEEYGEKWAQIAKYMPGKQRRAIRNRYMNHLKPGINFGKWTKEELRQLNILHERFGNKWCKIAAHLPGRTESQVKNWYYWGRKHPQSEELLSEVEDDDNYDNYFDKRIEGNTKLYKEIPSYAFLALYQSTEVDLYFNL